VAVLQTADGKLLRRTRPQGYQQTAYAVRSGPPGDPWYGDPQDWDGTNLVSYEQIYRRQAMVAGVLNKLARPIATLPLKLYKRNGDTDRERMSDHPLEQLLRQPVPRKGAVHTKWWMIFPLLLQGNALIGKVRPNPDSPPEALIPLDWAHISAWANPGEFVEWWSTTQYGDERFIKAEDTLHLAWPGCGEVGISPLEQLGTTIRLEDAAVRQQTGSFKTGIKPSIAVSVGQGARPEMLERTRESLEMYHGGPDNHGRALLLAPGSEVKTLNVTSQEAELIESRRLNLEEVCRVFDIPPPLVGDLRYATLSNVREYQIIFYRDVARPWLTLIEETLQAQLIDSEPAWAGQDLYLEFDLSEQLKGEPRELADTIKTEVEAGLMTRNEGRAILNLPPIGDPDDEENPANQLTVNVNNQGSLNDLGQEPEPPPQLQMAVDTPPQPPFAPPASQE
jgi:HK97 family phage portal protein